MPQRESQLLVGILQLAALDDGVLGEKMDMLWLVYRFIYLFFSAEPYHLSCGTLQLKNQLVSSGEHFPERGDRCQRGEENLPVTRTHPGCSCKLKCFAFSHLGHVIPCSETPFLL